MGVCPLMSYFFLLYVLIKHVVDFRNFQLFHEALEYQPMLPRTAIKITLFSGLLVQASTIGFMLVRTGKNVTKQQEQMVLTSGGIAIFSFLAFMILQSTGWIFPYRIFKKQQIIRAKRVSYIDRASSPYEDPFLKKTIL